MKNPELFSGIDMRLKSVKTIVEDEEPKQEYSKDVEKLRKFMDSNEPYLDPSLSVYDLAKQLSMSTKELSVLINHNLNQHFFDFINQYRIEKATKILQDPTKSNVTVLEILYEVGFNSKSSFNTAFKKHTGKTLLNTVKLT